MKITKKWEKQEETGKFNEKQKNLVLKSRIQAKNYDFSAKSTGFRRKNMFSGEKQAILA